ncbi:MAG: sigma-E factor negative regulatory protein [Ectothiorhodospiraceae bacterium]|nr:sigma-E factor negative regulatory protein [Ectothiorhodospiraceae bacterium]
MNEQRRAALSALMDGEGDDREREDALGSLLADDEGRRAWASYHLVRDAMRSQLPAHLDPALAARVAAAVAREPAVLAPRARRRPRAPVWGGLALAASLTALAIGLWPTAEDGTSVLAEAPAGGTRPSAPELRASTESPIQVAKALPDTTAPTSAEPRLVVLPEPAAMRAYPYMLSNAGASGSTIGYVRVVHALGTSGR